MHVANAYKMHEKKNLYCVIDCVLRGNCTSIDSLNTMWAHLKFHKFFEPNFAQLPIELIVHVDLILIDIIQIRWNENYLFTIRAHFLFELKHLQCKHLI